MERLKQIIEQRIKPALNAHGGDIELVEVTADRLVKVRLHGACSSCPGAQHTMTELVEAVIKAECPDIRGVVLISGVSEGLINQALKFLRRERQ